MKDRVNIVRKLILIVLFTWLVFLQRKDKFFLVKVRLAHDESDNESDSGSESEGESESESESEEEDWR